MSWISPLFASLSPFLLDYPLPGQVVCFQQDMRMRQFFPIYHGLAARETVVEPTGDGQAFIIYRKRDVAKLLGGVGLMVVEKIALIAPHHGDFLAELGEGEAAGFETVEDGHLDIWGEQSEFHQATEI